MMCVCVLQCMKVGKFSVMVVICDVLRKDLAPVGCEGSFEGSKGCVVFRLLTY